MEKGSTCGLWGLGAVGLAGKWLMDSNIGFCVYRWRRGQHVVCGDLVLWVWQGNGQWTVTLVSVFTGGEGVNVWCVGTWCCGSGSH